MPSTTPNGFQPGTLAPERRAFFDLKRQVTELQNKVDALQDQVDALSEPPPTP